MKLNRFIDALLHLLFLVVTNATQKLINKWIKAIRRTARFNVITDKLSKPISDMGLDWCKLINEELGWVSDNILAFARIITWHYHPVTILHAGKTFQELNTPVTKWLLPSYKEWLRAHGYEHDVKVRNRRSYIIELN